MIPCLLNCVLSQVDAFAAEAFKGNPAAVCLLENAAMATDERWLQAVAAEFNLPMTAFLLRDGTAPRFQLRWFTPITEVHTRPDHPPPNQVILLLN